MSLSQRSCPIQIRTFTHSRRHKSPINLARLRPTLSAPILPSPLTRSSSVKPATHNIAHSHRFHCLHQQSFPGWRSSLLTGNTITAPFAATSQPQRRDGIKPTNRALISSKPFVRKRTDLQGRERADQRMQLRHGTRTDIRKLALLEKTGSNRNSTGTSAEIATTKIKSVTATGIHSSGNRMEDDFQDTADLIEERTWGAGGGGRSRRGGGGGRRGGGGAGGPNRQVQISKALSTLLRHQAQNAGIKLDAEGFAPLDRVMQWPRLRNLNPTVQEIRDEVANNAKQRFSLKPHPDESIAGTTGEGDAAHWVIRANQGHTIAVASEALHTPVTLAAGNVPAVVVHGTYFAFWPAIVAAGGLRKMGRTHVHFGTGVPGDDHGDGAPSSTTTATTTVTTSDAQVHGVDDEERAAAGGKPKVISGMRSDAELLIFIDIERALRDSAAVSDEEGGGEGKGAGGQEIKWWMSENNVMLTEGNADGVVPLKYFKEVRGRRQGVGVLWKDGEKVADLPDGVVARVPQGKTRGGGGGGGGGRGGRGGRRGGRGR
ncbi:RNA 2'-phosphotransferase, Tpt1 [Nemania sp. FL0031]|nr:RNA 2'-phosphotransferase, Tpt1 [Nemania sp. FL0031]